MFTQSQTERLAKKFTATIIKALADFPQLLDQIDPEQAAEIVAGIIRTQLTTPTPPTDPGGSLGEILAKVYSSASEGGKQ